MKKVAADSRALHKGFRNVLGIALLYEGAIFLWALGADDITLPAILPIPGQQYYYYELIFLLPLFLITWLLASSIAYVLSRAFGGRGSFDSLLGGFGLSMSVSAYFTLIPDYIQGILWTTGIVPFATYLDISGKGILLIITWTYMAAYTLSHIAFYSLAIQHTQGLSGFRSVFVGLLSFTGSFCIWITFVR